MEEITMKEKMTVLAVGAHPDDIEMLCAGTLAKYAGAGHKVYMCHAANGNKGHFVIPSDELRLIRREEAKAAAAIIGAESISLDFPDCEIPPTKDGLDRFIDLIRQTRPDIIITHPPYDYMPDHVMVGKHVFDASFHATLPYYKTDIAEYHDTVAPIYYMDTLVGVGFLPQEYVDITEEYEIKRKALNCHQSQVTWLAEHDNIDIFEYIETSARFRGLQCDARYAEGFCRLDVWPRNKTERLLP
jgi:LmbE family N-acetylglucosaminyl deacetylase